jgi:lipopolysaccharide/colanic/teichoic acid biosynthesis glycosyltransferase
MTKSVQTVKRVIDTAAAAVGLAITAPLLPFIALAIYVDSPGPILYRQRRAGRMLPARSADRRATFAEFDMLKFRTMRTDAERVTGAVLAAENDPRITRVGRFLRKTRLDELPQLWNVIRGEMSLVGPRPERPELLRNLAAAIPFFEERMRNVKPGITGLAQVSLGYTGRPHAGSEIESHLHQLTNPYQIDEASGAEADDMRIKLLYDLAYSAQLERFSTFLATDLGVIARTPLTMLRGLGR